MTVPATAPVLSVEGVRKSFGEHLVLAGIDLQVAQGQCVVLIGASGSGKSTLLRAVNRLEEIDDGVIRLEGEDITDPRKDADAIRARMGMVFQAYNLFPHMRVIDNVSLASRLVHRVPRAQAAQAAAAMLDEVTSGARLTRCSSTPSSRAPRSSSGGSSNRERRRAQASPRATASISSRGTTLIRARPCGAPSACS